MGVDPMAEAREALVQMVRDVPDFPRPGIGFKDITPLLADPAGFRSVIDALASVGRGSDGVPAIDKVVGIEARGFILAAPVALALGVGFVPVRKQGKLPGPTHEIAYALEYGEAVVALHRDAIAHGERVLVVDDVLATGGTGRATADLVEQCGGQVVGLAVLLELSFLPGRATLGDVPVTTVATI